MIVGSRGPGSPDSESPGASGSEFSALRPRCCAYHQAPKLEAASPLKCAPALARSLPRDRGICKPNGYNHRPLQQRLQQTPQPLLNSPIKAKFQVSFLDQLFHHDSFPMEPARSVSPRLRIRVPRASAWLAANACSPDCGDSQGRAAGHVRASGDSPGGASRMDHYGAFGPHQTRTYV